MTSTPPQRPAYQAAPGREDRHGEMTGAISFNMVFVFLPVTIWCALVGPWLVGVRWTIAIGLALAVGLTLLGVPLSRWCWARFSAWIDRVNQRAHDAGAPR